MRSRIGGFAAAALIALLLSGCNNFNLLGEFARSASTEGPSGPAPLTISPVAPAILVGASINFTASGGTSPYSFALQSGGAGGSIYPTTGVYNAPITAGNDTVVLTDASGSTTTAVVTIVPASQLQISPTSVTIAVNSTYQFGVTGGASPYSYSIYSGGGSVNSTGLYTAPGSATTAYVRVTDSVGTISDATVSVVSGGPLTISPTSVQIPEGSAYSFAASGGTPPYTFTISAGTGTINASTGKYTAIGAVGASAATIKLTDSGASAPQYATVDIIPAAPSNLTIATAVGSMNLSWQNNATSVDNVVVQRKVGNGGSWSPLATLAPTATSYLDSVQPNNTLYFYRVYAVKGALQSQTSNEVFAVASP